MENAQSIERAKKIEKALLPILMVAGLFTIFVTIGIIFILSRETWQFFKMVPVLDFLFGVKWEPLMEPKSFGVLPLISGTLLISVGAGLLAIPAGIMIGIFLTEYAPSNIRRIVKPILEILAGIPTIVYGFFALTFVTPFLKTFMPDIEVFNALSGAIVVGIMILPMVASLVDDALLAIPQGLKHGAYALGATPSEVVLGVVIPACFGRIMAAFILAISRAIGETMAVTLAAGSNPQLTFNPLHSIQTMTSYIVQVALGDTPAGGVEYLTSYAVAFLLFCMTFSLNWIGHRIMQKGSK
ncbi:MAG: phosphate ABC transporter permease subunit PstC [Bdellovibrionales bacterium GWA2_49_15]|nr:MAG: phosphate ABC transporter permease subunit PstC [Bdellovibrionales bacterium GWA2_49_15]HAZ13941.1 phosphate ABC transporter permease subunit PstC [Bdellovibrionales bacterium]